MNILLSLKRILYLKKIDMRSQIFSFFVFHSIYGHVNHSAGWVIIKVNFSSILSEKCSADQYDSWTPTDNVSGGISGKAEKMVIKRDKIITVKPLI